MDMAESQRRLQADEQRVARGLNALRPSADELVSLMRVLRDKAGESVEAGSVDPLMRYLYDNLSSGIETIAHVPIACARGCAHCCRNTWIEATPPEVFFTVRNLPAGQRQAATESVLRACEKTEGASLSERLKLKVPCPLLDDDGVCGIYPIRPVACRIAVSANAEICRRSFMEQSGESIPVPAPWAPLRQGYRVALDAALLNAGLDCAMTEWNSALSSALADPGAEAAWLRGERVFGDLQRVPRPNLFQDPSWARLYAEAFGDRPPA